MFPEIESAIRTFFAQLTEVLGFTGYLLVFLGVELLFVLLFAVKSFFSYEARLKRRLNKLNKWIFATKKINEENVRVFTKKIKKGPKRLRYYWQQYILYREGTPSTYLTEDNIIGKPLKTSSWQNNIRNLGILTIVWSFVSLVFGLASQTTQTLTLQNIAVGLVIPALVGLFGVFTIVVLKAQRVSNLDDLYHLYHLFARFLDNACADLTPYIDFDLLFSAKEIEKGNTQLREYYEARTRKAKQEFDEANKNDLTYVEYKFDEVGVDGSLLLNRALKESEIYINQKTTTLSQISQIEAQKDALKRNYENVQMDLQRKIQASKENIAKLIEQQAATTSRIEVGLLRQQQEKEVAKQAALQKDYDQEEKRYNSQKNELDVDIEKLKKVLDEGQKEIEKAMSAEYQTFYEKIIKSAYAVADNKVADEKRQLTNDIEKTEGELINVQTQIKRLKDENDNLRAKIEETERALEEERDREANGKKSKKSKSKESEEEKQGQYDRAGNYVYEDGSYHDAQGLFHDVDGKIYNMNGELVSYEETEEEKLAKEREKAAKEQKEQFGKYVPFEPSDEYKNIEVEHNHEETVQEPVAKEEVVEESVPVEAVEETPALEPVIEEYAPVEEHAVEEIQPVVEEYVPETPVAKEEQVAADEWTRKRGRPRKTESDVTVVKAAESKKRGRPRKSRKDAEEEVQEPKKHPGRPRKETTETVEEPKKRPGRPRKETAPVAEEPKKRPGRPRKETSEVIVEEKRRVGRPKKAEVVEEPKKHPGRPKKEVSIAEEPKKHPGRPRKENKTEEPKRRVGRPKKEVKEETKEVAKRKPGRPKKEKFDTDFDDMFGAQNEEVNKQREQLLDEIDALTLQAENARQNGSDRELAVINKKLEEMINKLSNLNK